MRQLWDSYDSLLQMKTLQKRLFMSVLLDTERVISHLTPHLGKMDLVSVAQPLPKIREALLSEALIWFLYFWPKIFSQKVHGKGFHNLWEQGGFKVCYAP